MSLARFSEESPQTGHEPLTARRITRSKLLRSPGVSGRCLRLSLEAVQHGQEEPSHSQIDCSRLADKIGLRMSQAPSRKDVVITLALYCVVIFAVSWLGGVLPTLLGLTHTRLQLLISFVGGLMLGVGLLHQLPHAVAALSEAEVRSPLDSGMFWMLLGLTAMFLLLRMSHFHHHDAFEDAPHPGSMQHAPANVEVSGHHSGCVHDHDHDRDRLASSQRPDDFHLPASSWMGLAWGLSLHTLTDGLALAAHVEADLVHTPQTWLPGVGTFLGITLHKPLDSLSITSLMSVSKTSVRLRTLINLGYALLCPVGALLFQSGVRYFTSEQNLVVGAALAFSAGVFVCIALSDLLPELQFHAHDRVWLSAALIAGLTLSWLIGFVEPQHSHGFPAEPPATIVPTPQHDHPHRH